jgi:hypothetical protein
MFIQDKEILALDELNVPLLRLFIKNKTDGTKYALSSIHIRMVTLALLFGWAQDKAILTASPLQDYKDSRPLSKLAAACIRAACYAMLENLQKTRSAKAECTRKYMSI